MTKNKIARHRDYLIWIDLEMSGLELPKDVILEIAVIVTNNQLRIVAEGPSLVIRQPNEILETMNEWCIKQHGLSGLTKAVKDSSITLEDAKQKLMDFLKPYISEGQGVLCGNSVWQDKAFIQHYMPELDNLLHYKIIDVSSIKEVILRWYPKNPLVEFKKQDTHRALTDIRESIEELKYYRNHFFIAQSDGQ